jgi:hypothetical protein
VGELTEGSAESKRDGGGRNLACRHWGRKGSTSEIRRFRGEEREMDYAGSTRRTRTLWRFGLWRRGGREVVNGGGFRRMAAAAVFPLYSRSLSRLVEQVGSRRGMRMGRQGDRERAPLVVVSGSRAQLWRPGQSGGGRVQRSDGREEDDGSCESDMWVPR